MQPQTSTIMSLDVGDKRIGLATADMLNLLPHPSGIVEMSDKTAEEICNKILENHVRTLVVGLPRGMDGQETPQTQYVRNFVEKLKSKINIPIKLQDEALTSKLAEEELSQRGVRYNKGDVDALAATYILRDYIDENRESLL